MSNTILEVGFVELNNNLFFAQKYPNATNDINFIKKKPIDQNQSYIIDDGLKKLLNSATGSGKVKTINITNNNTSTEFLVQFFH